MDLLRDQPVPSKAAAPAVMPAYLTWLAAGQGRAPLAQKVLVQTLEAQIGCVSWPSAARAWLTYPYSIASTCAEHALESAGKAVLRWRCQLAESSLFYSGAEAKMPVHSE